LNSIKTTSQKKTGVCMVTLYKVSNNCFDFISFLCNKCKASRINRLHYCKVRLFTPL